MAVSVVLSEIQRDTLARVCDTFAPSLERDDDPTGFWARAASDLGIPDAIELQLAEAPEEQVAGLRELLDALAAQGFNDAPQEVREQILHGVMDVGPRGARRGQRPARADAAALLRAAGSGLRASTRTGRRSATPARGRHRRARTPLPRRSPSPGRSTPTSCSPPTSVVVGSGAGGGVIAGELTAAGRDVVVLEMGGYYNEADFNQLELWAYQNLYRGGGITQTDDGSVALMAGSNLGGGTTVNWTNCLRTTPWVREQWARRVRPRGPGHGDLRRPSRRGVAAHRRHRGVQRLQRPAPAPARGVPGGRIFLEAHHPQHRPGDLRPRHRRAAGLRRPERLQAGHAEDLPAGRRRPRRPLRRRLPGRARAHRERPGDRGRGHLHRRRRAPGAGRRPRSHAWWSRAARWSRRRCSCDRASAGRPAATTCGCIPPPRWPESTPSRRRAGGGRRRPGSPTSSPTPATATAT